MTNDRARDRIWWKILLLLIFAFLLALVDPITAGIAARMTGEIQ